MQVKILISMPESLAKRMKHAIPGRQRSAVIVNLLQREVEKREKRLYEAALAVEQDAALHHEMAEWNVTLQDGLDE